jgi:predicted nucleotidyltransferase component of viral defense system
MRGEAPHVVRVDFSLNEPLGGPVLLEIGENRSIQVYSFQDLVAEKLRAVLQQQIRNRMRKQDIYDLHFLINNSTDHTIEETRTGVLYSLKEKAAARNLAIDRDSMRNPEIYRRSSKEYELLVHEIEGPLPDFDDAYNLVRSYYEALPWGDQTQ